MMTHPTHPYHVFTDSKSLFLFVIDKRGTSVRSSPRSRFYHVSSSSYPVPHPQLRIVTEKETLIESYIWNPSKESTLVRTLLTSSEVIVSDVQDETTTPEDPRRTNGKGTSERTKTLLGLTSLSHHLRSVKEGKR